MTSSPVLGRDGVPPPLRGLVARLWSFEQVGGGGSELRLPDGGLEVVLRLDGPGRRAAEAREPAFLVAGPRSRAEMLDTSAPGRLVGAHLHPGSATALLGVPAAELRDQDVDLAALWGRSAGEIAERIAAAPTADLQLAELARGLAGRAGQRPVATPVVGAALRRLSADPACARVAEVVASSGVSWGRFIRLFEEEVGLTPKRFQRVLRLQRAVQGLRRPPVGGAAEVALDAGYADQAHLVREFRALTGLTAGAYQRAAPEQANHVPLP